MSLTGGLSETKAATPVVQEIVDQVKPQFESQVDKKCGIFKAVEYRTQVVGGTNYFVKVQISPNEYVHLRVFQPLPCENDHPRLDGYQTGKNKDDPLTYF